MGKFADPDNFDKNQVVCTPYDYDHLKTHYKHSFYQHCASKKTSLNSLHQDVQEMFDNVRSISRHKQFYWWPITGFDHNCRRRLLGFLQGKFYRMVDMATMFLK